MPSAEELVEAYRRGDATPRDLCEALMRGDLDDRTVATLLKVGVLSVRSYCRSVLGRSTEAMAAEEARIAEEEPVYPASTRGRRGAAAQPAAVSPTREVLAQLSAQVATEATAAVGYYIELGKEIHNMVYFYASRDPRYAEALKTDPRATVVRFVEDALATYIGLAEVLNRIRSVIYRLLEIIDRYDQVLRRLAPRLYPSFVAELETRAVLTLIDRLILARILGVKLGNVPRFMRLWFEYQGERMVREHLAQLFGVPLEEVYG